jgi:hypothetical protein
MEGLKRRRIRLRFVNVDFREMAEAAEGKARDYR